MQERREEPKTAAWGKARRELKYLCTKRELALFDGSIRNICSPDIHADERGCYRVRSLYFDTYDNRCLHENENGTEPREKFRIRIYQEDFSYIMLECKHKAYNSTYKEQCRISQELCRQIIGGGFERGAMDIIQSSDSPLLRKFCLQYCMSYLRPKVVIAYDRTAYLYPSGNVRITFDRNIAACGNVELFMEKEIPVRPVMYADEQILEVKYDELLPGFLRNALQRQSLQQTAFSKYYYGRKSCF